MSGPALTGRKKMNADREGTAGLAPTSTSGAAVVSSALKAVDAAVTVATAVVDGNAV
jgi:hypothetical protein